MPQKWMEDLRKMEYREHRARIREMKPTVDNQEPHKMPFSQKAATERRLYAEKVQQENRLVLDRIGKAMEGCRLDNKPYNFVQTSVNADNRRLFLQTVTAENQRMLYRIQNVDPVYNRIHWERDALAKEHILRNMTQFPKLYVPHYLPTLKSKKVKTENSIAQDLANNYLDEDSQLNRTINFAESSILDGNASNFMDNLGISISNSSIVNARLDAFDLNNNQGSVDFMHHSTPGNNNNSNRGNVGGGHS